MQRKGFFARLADLFRGIFGVKLMLLPQSSVEEKTVTDQVDSARYPTTVLVDQAQRTFIDCRIPLPANAGEAVFYVIYYFIKTQRLKVRSSNKALMQVFHARCTQHLQQLFLANQEYL